jgi:hypothetical protein
MPLKPAEATRRLEASQITLLNLLVSAVGITSVPAGGAGVGVIGAATKLEFDL